MKRELFFEDGSVVEVIVETTVKGEMATAALQRLIEYLDYDLPHEPEIGLQAEPNILDLEEEIIDEEDLEDLADIDEEWLEEDDWEEVDEEEEEDPDDWDEDWDEDEDV